ncbi:hypothetical protein GBAR_LOCUS9590, partial [Geodia barretti]
MTLRGSGGEKRVVMWGEKHTANSCARRMRKLRTIVAPGVCGHCVFLREAYAHT